MKKNRERFLEDFENGQSSNAAFKCIKDYLINAIQPTLNCRAFDKVRY